MTARADLLITHARPWSDGAKLGGSDAVAIEDSRILAVGREADLRELAGPLTRHLDARGGTVTPGCWDAHLHLLPWARARNELDLAGAASASEVASRLGAHLAAHPGRGPVVGRGWDREDWPDAPHRALLDSVSASRPVLLHSRDFHALWVNSAALMSANVNAATADPSGGLIERDGTGAPTGVLRENAVRFCSALEDEAAREGVAPLDLLARAARELHAMGITAVHDFERGEGAFRTMERFARGPAPSLRVLQCVGPEDLERVRALGLRSGDGDDRFRVGPLKLFADGTLGSRTAALLAPYDHTDSCGLEVLPPADLADWVRRGSEAGLTIAVHAIGDRACRNALDAIESIVPRPASVAVRGEPAAMVPPCRLEHVQLLTAEDAPRFAALGVAASMQPLHCVSDSEMARRYWGARCERSYPWRTLLDRGTLLAFGSDAPVESPSIAAAIGAALTRCRNDGTPPGGFVPAQRIGLDAALTAFTAGGARLAGVWPRLGSLRAGSLADVVIWDRDLHAAPAARLHEARPSCTVGHGVILFERRPGAE